MPLETLRRIRQAGTPAILATALAGGAALAQTAPQSAADRAVASGESALQSGDFATAVDQWALAARLSSETGSGRAQVIALLRLADAQQALGGYTQARGTLQFARTIVETSDDQQQRAQVLGALGNVLSTLSRTEIDRAQRIAGMAEATQTLNAALSLAEAAKAPGVASAILTNLANHEAAEDNLQGALSRYERSAEQAMLAGQGSLAARALANHARVAQRAGDWSLSESSLGSARALALSLPASHDKAFTLTSIGHSYAELIRAQPLRSTALGANSEQAFESAAAAAEQITDHLALSYVYGYLGALYEQTGRPAAALSLTRRALFAAMQAQDRLGHFSGGIAEATAVGVTAPAGDALYRWHYQLGRLHAAEGRLGQAIDEARRAVDVLQSIRFDIATGYAMRPASFRDTVEPVFHFLVKLLLEQSQRASEDGDQARRRVLIAEARLHVEHLKAAELRDYFRDDCVDALLAAERDASQIDPTAAVIYPVLLDDRTDILVNLPNGGLEQFSLAIGRAQITEAANAFRHCIADASCFDFAPGRQLYEWLIQPLEPQLTASGVKTLIFVPDGPLRTVPMAALHDGKQYLVQRYAIATIPALSLVDPRPLQSAVSLRVLRTGMSDATDGFDKLPNVVKELDGIGKYYPDGDVLLNDDFTPERLDAALAGSRYSVVHIASHGEFRNDASEAYLQTRTGPLLMNDLADSIGRLRFRGLSTAGAGPELLALELLVLSACETAEGDERAALGLAGLAIKAGARSALGTLWSVNDEAAAALVVEFYKQLKNTTGVSKARALQLAQIEILKSRFAHPQYWSAFLLISNWL